MFRELKNEKEQNIKVLELAARLEDILKEKDRIIKRQEESIRDLKNKVTLYRDNALEHKRSFDNLLGQIVELSTKI